MFHVSTSPTSAQKTGAWVQLDDPDFSIHISRDSDFQNWRSIPVGKEPWTFDWLRNFDDTVVFYDVGACVGGYSLMAGARGAHVYAFEPLPWNVGALLQNLRRNRIDMVVAPFVVGSTDGPVTLNTSAHVQKGFGLASVQQHYHDHRDNVQLPMFSMRLDTFVEMDVEFPTHIKIDVEGGEIGVLAGASRVLADERLRSIIVEAHDQSAEDTMAELMTAAGFRRHWRGGDGRTFDTRTLIYERG